ncbi:MAG TPA: V-type ATP synthase subunit F [Treponemataceae bacterium]|nr:MAG: V-type ATP synthase subunit F [Spirochaetes bacterium ADurb.Bin269]TAH54768.1 MAG: ATPase V [Treponema sp.]HOC28538.1 V-type ATP synthase subunit F [Treponemataceae bacterium]HPX47339.1 V-type ATP synthase subunit F [Treponemataceae bacterium]HQL31881.1 V-type ATP synthase subunit F [Treponemataceae bacterium]
MKYHVIGERELVLGFALVGINGTVASTREEAFDAFMRVTGRGNLLAGGVPVEGERAMVLILTEEVSAMLEEEVRDWQMNGEYPLVVEIPGLHGHLAGRKTLTDSIREAIGIHV